MASRIGGNDDEAIAEINVVPLVDIILVVLIIFMVTAPLVLKPSMEITLPKSSTGDSTPTAGINIALARDGVITLNGAVSTLEAVTELASQKAKADPEAIATLSADKDVTVERLIEMMDIIKGTGIRRVPIMIEKK